MATASMSVTSTHRVIALVDMDCFYVQVEERDDPSIKGAPAAVVQYKAYKGGGIIAVNYEARARGVTRQMRGDDAKAVCPEIQLVRVPEVRGKADLTKYRDGGREVINVLTEFSPCVERASIDEAYIDLTEAVEVRMTEISSEDVFVSWQESIVKSLELEYLSTNFVLGHESTSAWLDALKESEIPSLDDIKLAIGAEIVGKMRDAVYKKTGFRCSAGIAHNKVVAKLVCGINKPNKQTVLPHSSVPALWASTKIGKVRGLGGKLGDYLIERLGCAQMSDLSKFTEKQLCSELGTKTGQWLYQLCLGYDDEPVTPRQLPKSIGCNKNFLGPEALRTKEKVKFWIGQLAAEVTERIQRDLEMNSRRAKTLTLHIRFEDQNAISRSCGVNPKYNAERMAGDVYTIMEKLYQSVGVLPVVSLGLIASKFEDEVDISGYAKIDDFFKSKPSTSNDCADSSEYLDSNSSAVELPSKTNEPQHTSNLVPVNESSKSKNDQKLKKDLTKENSALSKFLVSREPQHQVNANHATSSSAFIASSSSTSTFSEGIETEIPKNPNTPTKSTVNTEPDTANEGAQRRKTFFTFSAGAPSPRKSPRKLVTSSATAEAGACSSKQPEPDKGFIAVKECERCGKKFNIDEFALHMDYHYAKDLSRELNGLPAAQPAQSTGSTSVKTKEVQKRPRGRGASSSSTSKRGRPAKSSSGTSASSGQLRKIDSYFTSRS